MPFQIMIAIEALWTLIAFERPIGRRRLWLIAIDLHVCCMAAIECRDYASHPTYELHVSTRTMQVG